MQQFDRELTAYGQETKRLTRESNAQAALKAGQTANAGLPPPMPLAEHEANVRQLHAKEEEESCLRADRVALWRTANAERAELKAFHKTLCGVPFSYDGDEYCTRTKHEWGDHLYVVDGQVISGWNGQTYYVGWGERYLCLFCRFPTERGKTFCSLLCAKADAG